ncbi:hypothetical protein ACIA48_03980 [Mycobacterium sp. NPDC051804]|uniref:hypothetical protein n=1 Tax=Mycobacterium sp. NPDC051804 TaxID=3364295 RepID=UPI0037A80B36
MMRNLEHRLVRPVVIAAAALSFLIAPMVLTVQAAETDAAPCYPGFVPGNPYVPSCNVGPRVPRVRGGPPDQAAVIACRDIPGCLSWYINNPH